MKKKIAFITDNFMGSILPLCKRLCQRGHHVDIYFYRRSIHEPEACLLDYKADHYGINIVPKEACSNISTYVQSEDINIFTISQIKPYASVPLLRNVTSMVAEWQIRKAAGQLNARNYDVINIVCNYNMPHLIPLMHYLEGNVIVSLHEVWNHLQPSTKPSPLLTEAIVKGCKLFVFSENAEADLQKIEGVDPSKVRCVPFGLFESYKALPPASLQTTLPGKYLLFFGYILPYKGLKVLYDAIGILGKELGDFKVVIAGKGNDPILDKIKNHDRFVTIRRFIKNSELTTLLNGAYAVVCPYLTMSQSGIPQTAFPFNVPIIASNLKGFRNVITEDNGMLFKRGDAPALAGCIREIINNPSRHDEMCQNISMFTSMHPQYNWNNICDQYLKSI